MGGVLLQYSYGVTLWELMTRGGKPYASVDSFDVKRFLKSGRRLAKPATCPPKVYVIHMLASSMVDI